MWVLQQNKKVKVQISFWIPLPSFTPDEVGALLCGLYHHTAELSGSPAGPSGLAFVKSSSSHPHLTLLLLG